MKDLNQLLKTSEFIKAQKALDELSDKLKVEGVDYASINVGNGHFWVYYSDIEEWEKDAGEVFLNKVCLDLSKYNVKPLTIKWWRLIARFTREYWRYKIPPKDWASIAQATSAFNYFEECSNQAKLKKIKSVEVSLDMVDLLVDWFKYVKRLVIKK